MAEDRVFTAEEQEFTGAVLTGLFRQSADISNRLDEMRLAEIADWKKRFAMLYRSMEKVADRTDSATAYGALNRFSYDMEAAQKGPSEHLGYTGGV